MERGEKEGEGEREREAESCVKFPQSWYSFHCVTGDLTGIELTSSLYPPGDYVLTISAIDVEEQITTVQVNLTIQSNHTSYNCYQI